MHAASTGGRVREASSACIEALASSPCMGRAGPHVRGAWRTWRTLTVCEVEHAPLDPDAVVPACSTHTHPPWSLNLHQAQEKRWRKTTSAAMSAFERLPRGTLLLLLSYRAARTAWHTSSSPPPSWQHATGHRQTDAPCGLKRVLLQAAAVKVYRSMRFGQREQLAAAIHQHLAGRLQQVPAPHGS